MKPLFRFTEQKTSINHNVISIIYVLALALLGDLEKQFNLNLISVIYDVHSYVLIYWNKIISN